MALYDSPEVIAFLAERRFQPLAKTELEFNEHFGYELPHGTHKALRFHYGISRSIDGEPCLENATTTGEVVNALRKEGIHCTGRRARDFLRRREKNGGVYNRYADFMVGPSDEAFFKEHANLPFSEFEKVYFEHYGLKITLPAWGHARVKFGIVHQKQQAFERITREVDTYEEFNARAEAEGLMPTKSTAYHYFKKLNKEQPK